MAGLFAELCSFRNLEMACRKASAGKRSRPDVQEFSFYYERNLLQIKHELESGAYKPSPLRTFVISDPKTRRISASAFRDRVVHHALVNVIQSLFEKTFIHDSYANRKGKGTHAALRRFDVFKRKASQNNRPLNHTHDNTVIVGYALKADIRHYFEEVDHSVLLSLLARKITDERTFALIRIILANHHGKQPGRGMPLGNLTSQFFANVYLHELDRFVKHTLRVRWYLRYVDDFVILHTSLAVLEAYKQRITAFLPTLGLALHPDKSRIFPLHHGTRWVGYRVFPYHRLPTKANRRHFLCRLAEWEAAYAEGALSPPALIERVSGWLAYAAFADTFAFRRNVQRRLRALQEKGSTPNGSLPEKPFP